MIENWRGSTRLWWWPHNVQFLETKGEMKVEGVAPNMYVSYYTQPMKTKKHAIGIEINSKISIMGDYYDEEIVSLVIDFLKEYEYIFMFSN